MSDVKNSETDEYKDETEGEVVAADEEPGDDINDDEEESYGDDDDSDDDTDEDDEGELDYDGEDDEGLYDDDDSSAEEEESDGDTGKDEADDDDDENESSFRDRVKVSDESEPAEKENDPSEVSPVESVDGSVEDDAKSKGEKTEKEMAEAPPEAGQVLAGDGEKITAPLRLNPHTKKKPMDPEMINSLAVTLTFETARKTITLNELRSIHAGYTFVSEDPVTAPIEIRANGKLIGYGKLVSVENNIGVQITEFA